MKNPLKKVGDAIKNLHDRFKNRKRESAKTAIDGLGDSGIVGGIALIATSVVLPAAPATMIAAGTIFVLGGVTAKVIASKMKPDAYDVTKPQDVKPAGPPPDQRLPKVKKPGPDFTKAHDADPAQPKDNPAKKPGAAPKPA